VDVYRWRISQVGRRHGEMAVKFGVIMVVICVPLADYRQRYTYDLAGWIKNERIGRIRKI